MFSVDIDQHFQDIEAIHLPHSRLGVLNQSEQQSFDEVSAKSRQPTDKVLTTSRQFRRHPSKIPIRFRYRHGFRQALGKISNISAKYRQNSGNISLPLGFRHAFTKLPAKFQRSLSKFGKVWIPAPFQQIFDKLPTRFQQNLCKASAKSRQGSGRVSVPARYQ